MDNTKTIDLSVAHDAGTAIIANVNTPELNIRRVDAPFRMRIGQSGATINVTSPEIFESKDCKSPIGAVYIENDAGSGVAELFWSDSIKAGKVDAAAATAAARVVVELDINPSGNKYTEQVTGQDAGVGSIKWDITGTHAYAQHATKKFYGMLMETSTAHEALRLSMDVPLRNLFSPDVVGLSLARYEGCRWEFEMDAYCEQVYTPSASDISHFIGFGGVSGAGSWPGFGLWRNKTEVNWSLKLWDNATFIINRPLAVPCLDAYSVVKFVVGVTGGVAYMDTKLNGVVVDTQKGPWPAALAAGIAGVAFRPMCRVYRQNVAPDESRMYVAIARSVMCAKKLP